MNGYVLYINDEPQGVFGSYSEIAKHMGVKPETARFYSTPAYKRRVANSKRSRVVEKY